MPDSVAISTSNQVELEGGSVDIDSLITGLTVLEQTEPELPPNEASVKIELVPFLEGGETCVPGEEVAARAKRLAANYGRRLARVLVQNQGPLLKEWRRFCIIFTGFKMTDARGDKRVLGLSWNGKKWYIGLRWLDRSFGHHTRLVRIVG